MTTSIAESVGVRAKSASRPASRPCLLRTDRCGGLEAKVSIGLEALLVDSKNFHIYKASCASAPPLLPPRAPS